MNEQVIQQFRIILLGNSEVGKSSLIRRYQDDIFDETYQPTIGIDLKNTEIPMINAKYKLQLWDTAGEVRQHTYTYSYYKGADAFIFVYDITNEHSFKCIEQNYVKAVKQHGKVDVISLLVGNKSDLEQNRVISKAQGQELADKLGVKFMETSVKQNIQVDNAFTSLTEQCVYQRLTQAPQSNTNSTKFYCCLQ